MSIQKVNGHIDAMERKIGKCIKIAEKGSSMKLGDVVKMGRKANSIVSELKKSTSEYDGTNPSADEANAILTKMDKITGMTETQMNLILTHKARIEELRVGGLVKRNLLKTQEAGAAFSDQLRSKAPDNLKPAAEALEKRRHDAFAKTISAYANAAGGEDQDDEADDSD